MKNQYRSIKSVKWKVFSIRSSSKMYIVAVGINQQQSKKLRLKTLTPTLFTSHT